MPERFIRGDYLSEKIEAIDSSFKGTLALLGMIQIAIVSILDIYTSGQGTAYYLIDFIYLFLQIVGILMIDFSLAHCKTDMKLYIIDVYFQIQDSPSDTKRKTSYVLKFCFTAQGQKNWCRPHFKSTRRGLLESEPSPSS